MYTCIYKQQTVTEKCMNEIDLLEYISGCTCVDTLIILTYETALQIQD